MIQLGRLTQSALIGGQDLPVLRQSASDQIGFLTQVAAGSFNEEQAKLILVPVLQLAVKLDSAKYGFRHYPSP